MLFFALAFAALFVAMAAMRFLAFRLGWAAPQGQLGDGRGDLAGAARWALSLAIYAGILLALGYAAIERVFAPAAILSISLMALGFAFGAGLALDLLPSPPRPAAAALGEPGLILFGNGGAGNSAEVLLGGPGEPPRVLADPGGPMVFAEGPARAGDGLSPSALGGHAPPFLRGVAADLRLNSEILRDSLARGPRPFLVYAGALVFMLTSLMCVLKLGMWPLANLFMGALAFRGALALEAFLSSGEAREAFASLSRGLVPAAFAAPAVFAAVGILGHLFSLLIFFRRRRARHAAA